MLAFSIKLTTISVTWLKAKFRFQRIHQTHLIISSGTHITINKACLHLVSCNSPTLSAPQRTSIMEEIRITSVYFRMSRLLRASAISSRVSYFISRGVTSVARWHNLVCILRGGIFHCLSSSCLHCASFSRSHPRLTCATLCIVFTSHAAYIILTSVAGGNVRYFSVFLPNFFYVFFTCCSRNLPRENTLALQFE